MKFTSLSLLFGVISVVNCGKVYHDGDSLPIRVKPLTFGGNSYDEKLYLYPVDYYNKTLDNCSPVQQKIQNPEEDKIVGFKSFFNNNFKPAPLNTTFNSDKDKCTLICDKNYKEVNVSVINDLIKKNYKLNFYVDDMPVGRELYDSQTGKFYIDLGVPLGYLDAEKVPHYFNHFQFVVYYTSQGLSYEVLYATVSTQSLTRIPQVPLSCGLTPPMLLRYSDHAYNGNRVTFGVIYKEVEVNKVLSKWDLYKNDVVRPFISNSLLFIFTLLTGLIAAYSYIILKNALTTEKLSTIYKNRDSKVNDKDEENSSSDDLYEFSWPSLINDVFRKPRFSMILYYFVSLGLLSFTTLGLTILRLGFGLNPYDDDLFKVVIYHFYFGSILQSIFNAYLMKLFSALNESISKTDLFINGLLNSLFLPLILSVFVGKANFAYKLVNSPVRILSSKFNPVVQSYILVTLITYGLTFYFVKLNNLNAFPKVNEIPKKIVDLPITFKLIPNSIITGIFPFGIILIPLSTAYLTFWYNHFFSNNNITLVFQFLLFIGLISTINILNLYYLLSIGNWEWQWKSFINGTSIGIFSFIYTFYLTKFRFGDYSSFLIALLQNLTFSLLLSLMGGFVSFTVSFLIVRQLYTDISLK